MPPLLHCGQGRFCCKPCRISCKSSSKAVRFKFIINHIQLNNNNPACTKFNVKSKTLCRLQGVEQGGLPMLNININARGALRSAAAIHPQDTLLKSWAEPMNNCFFVSIVFYNAHSVGVLYFMIQIYYYLPN